jgi:DNA-binding LytR/AlgR family response regulator
MLIRQRAKQNQKVTGSPHPARPAPVVSIQWERESNIAATPLPPANHAALLTHESRVFIKQNRRFVPVLVADIQFVAAKNNYISLFANGRSYLLRQTLKEMEALLPAGFIRIHRCHIINTRHLAGFTCDEAVLGSQHLPIGANFYDLLVESLFVLG